MTQLKILWVLQAIKNFIVCKKNIKKLQTSQWDILYYYGCNHTLLKITGKLKNMHK
jgi:hypothetical protein